ncbi:MAG: phosphonate C-P lyase system protein PhnG [Anaerolineaceae bacterium]|nr:phosphonate C-P lyase system protein PhnG [Anaerolineaceae bacterium]
MSYTQSEYLTVLTHAPADAVKNFVEDVIPYLGEIEVLVNRTGLVMLPYTDTSTGTRFHLGEVLVSEAHVRIAGGTEGYAVCVGRDVQQALAVALFDAALSANILTDSIQDFIAQQQAAQQAADEQLLKQVESTRIEMETF